MEVIFALLYRQNDSHFVSGNSEGSSFPWEIIEQRRWSEGGTEVLLPCDFLKPYEGPSQWRPFEKAIDVGFRVSFPSSCVLGQRVWVLRWWMELGSCEHKNRDKEKWVPRVASILCADQSMLFLIPGFWLGGKWASASVCLPACTRRASFITRSSHTGLSA